LAKSASKSKRTPSAGKGKPGQRGSTKSKARKMPVAKRVVDPVPRGDPFKL
jgi:hypothetical protein